MILGASLLRFYLSSGGIITMLLLAVLWLIIRPGKRPPRLLVVAALAYVPLSSLALAELGASWLASPFHELTRNDVPPGRVAVVLLGSGAITATDWNGGTYSVPDPAGTERTLEAARVYRLLDARWVISSGGAPYPDDPDLPSAISMREALLHMGLPPDRVLLEQQSRTTREEATIIGQMLKSLGAEQLVLVSSATHMRRSLGVFRSAGMSPIPAVARQSSHVNNFSRFIPSHYGLNLSEEVLHEIVGLFYYRLRGWQN